MGERRMRASQRAGLEYIPAIVRETSDNDMLRDALIENLHRAQLDPLEEAAAYKQLLDDFGATHERLAQRIVAEGLSVRSVEEIVSLGGDDDPARAARRPVTAKPVAPALRTLSDRLSDLFETRVKVEMGAKKGKITVEFATIDDLERIVKAMSPEADASEA